MIDNSLFFLVGGARLELATNGLKGASLASAHLLIKYLRRLPCNSRSLHKPRRAKACRTLVQKWLQLQRWDAPLQRNADLSASSERFSSAINFCATQLQANRCREVERLPKNVARRRCNDPDELDAFKTPPVQKFKDRQIALHVDLRYAMGMRPAGMRETGR
jgi:hypothetical protein